MKRLCLSVVWLALPLAIGCGWGSDEEDDYSDEFPELSATTETTTEEQVQDPASPAAGQLQLNLSVGDRFPLVKTIEQTLNQQTPNGLVTSRSVLTLKMAVAVEQADAAKTRLSVRYERVQYTHDVAGEIVAYDSSSPPPVIPEAVQAYHGLVDNGFSVWIGPDNRIIEVVDFENFLHRCARHLPADQRDQFLQRLAANQGDEGVANFIDDIVGVLPYQIAENGQQTPIKRGDRWSKERPVLHPLPLHLKTFYELANINDEVAEIDIYGTITPSTTTAYGAASAQNRSQKLTIRDGHCTGKCTIDLKTGLPIASRIVRDVDMQVQGADGVGFEQRKRIVTTIQAFPQQGVARVIEDSSIRQAGGAETYRPPPSNATQANFRNSAP